MIHAPPLPILSLHRHWVSADLMRLHFHDRRRAHKSPETFVMDVDGIAYMGLWYGTLFVVVEGWRELGLHDEEIDGLLQSPNTELLRRYRNAMFHFQKNPFDERFVEFMDEPSTVPWVKELHGAFNRWFSDVIKNSFGGELPEWFRALSVGAPSPPEPPPTDEEK